MSLVYRRTGGWARLYLTEVFHVCVGDWHEKNRSSRGGQHSSIIRPHNSLCSGSLLGPLTLGGRGQGRIQDFLKKGGGHFRSTSEKRGSRRGSNFRPNVKKHTTWAKKGGPPPGPPWIRQLGGGGVMWLLYVPPLLGDPSLCCFDKTAQIHISTNSVESRTMKKAFSGFTNSCLVKRLDIYILERKIVYTHKQRALKCLYVCGIITAHRCSHEQDPFVIRSNVRKAQVSA